MSLPNEAEVAVLKAAFELVANKDHWKGPIDTHVRWEFASLVGEAIEFYTATTPTFGPRMSNGYCRVQSVGYWAGPAGP